MVKHHHNWCYGFGNYVVSNGQYPTQGKWSQNLQVISNSDIPGFKPSKARSALTLYGCDVCDGTELSTATSESCCSDCCRPESGGSCSSNRELVLSPCFDPGVATSESEVVRIVETDNGDAVFRRRLVTPLTKQNLPTPLHSRPFLRHFWQLGSVLSHRIRRYRHSLQPSRGIASQSP